jgi:hypothetical protein
MMTQPADTQVSIDHLHVADAEPAPPATTLGQTPHEPTVRPWELELLISGALVFSMIQLPGQLDAWFDGLRPRLGGEWFMAAFMMWFYTKMALYALVGGFVVHLAVRGYWVGVIGIEAVFPGGIAWDRMRSGPIMRDIARARTPSLQSLIDRADRLASMIFGAAFAFALLFGYSLVMGSILVLGAAALSRWLIDDPAKALVVMEVVLFAVIGPTVLAGLSDRQMGDRLAPDSRLARIIRRIGAASGRFGATGLFMPLIYTLLTNLRLRRQGSVFVGVIAAFLALVMVKDVLLPRGVIRTDGYTFLPAAASREVLPGFYADQRGTDADFAKLPQIQSDIIRDPYVRLFIPYFPRRHNLLISRRCPGVPRRVEQGSGAEVLRCMAALQPVTLNGRPLAASWSFSTQPGNGMRGIVAYIPAATLPRGENVLTVGQLPSPDSAATAKPETPYRIPFWL